jgi:hypothetical protein
MESDPRPQFEAPVSRRHASDAAGFSAGAALSTSFRIFGTQALVLVPLAALFLAIPLVFEVIAREAEWEQLSKWIAAEGPEWSEAGESWDSLDLGGREHWIWFAVVSIVPLAFQALVAYAVFRRLSGSPARYGASFAHSLGRLPVVMLSSLVMALAMGAPLILAAFADVGSGLVLLMLVYFVLFVQLTTRWYVAIQAAVVEPVGPIEALGRSNWLTHGVKMRIFGMLLLLYGLPSVIEAVLQDQLIDTSVLVSDPDAPAPKTDLWIGFAIDAVVHALAAVTAAVVYTDLRRVREGTGLDQVLAVFD